MDDIVARAKALVVSHEDYSREADLDRVMTNVAEDVVLLAANAPLIEGAESFRAFYAELFAMGRWDFGHDYHGAFAAGDEVFLHGVANGRLTAEDGTVTEFVNNFLHVWRTQEDGSLRMWRLAFAPATPSS